MNHYDGPAFFRKYHIKTPKVNHSAAASQSTPAPSAAERSATAAKPAVQPHVTPSPQPKKRRQPAPAKPESARELFSGGTHGSFHPSHVPSQLAHRQAIGPAIVRDTTNYLEIEASLHKQPDSYLLFASDLDSNEPVVDLQAPVVRADINATSTGAADEVTPAASVTSEVPAVNETSATSEAPTVSETSANSEVPAASEAVANESSASSGGASAQSSAPTEVFEPTKPVMARPASSDAGPTIVFEPTQALQPTSSIDSATDRPAPVASASQASAAESAVGGGDSQSADSTSAAPQSAASAEAASATNAEATSQPARPSHGLGISLGDIMTAEHDAQSDLALFKDQPASAAAESAAVTDVPANSTVTSAPTSDQRPAASSAPAVAEEELYQPVGMHPNSHAATETSASQPVSAVASAERETTQAAGSTAVVDQPVAPQPAPATVSSAPTSQVSAPASETPMHTGGSAAPVLTDKELAAYHFPPMSLLKPPVVLDESEMDDWIEQKENALEETLDAFKVNGSVVDWTVGPTITQFQVKLDLGVKVSKITNLEDDIKMALEAKQLRIEAPIPGRNTVGIEIPNEKSRPVMLSEVLNSKKFKESQSPLTVALGVDLFGQPQVTDLRKMPHGLIAGSTGSGKSVFINSILVSLLYRANPQQVKLLLIDPKAVELAPYNNIPHLLSPVISDPKAASAALKWAVDEMDNRYDRLAAGGARNIEQFNRLADEHNEPGLKMPYIVIVIDELADLMMVASSEFQDYIARITAKARAAGIHLLVATQRPSVDVVTGVIKNNIPTRVAFMTSSQVDSRTVLDTSGAEQLLGRGDMLYLGNGQSNPIRLQGTFVDSEIDAITQFVRDQAAPKYEFQPDSLLKHEEAAKNEDDLMPEVLAYIAEEDTVSTSKLQRSFSIGYNRAANIIDDLEHRHYVSAAKGSKPRDVYFTADDLTQLQANS
ncbi:DNA translocase FtsK [Lactiplantibacillus plajomi]|uniref:DNA translocase FtsK n=1 Tax=Lactiplantibacillus plajomi TaxID=1457217 RepID=A0ABV6JZN3_9LACO|nr:DNA translocase FtsK [Lactiplantibacillus plajomi]